MSAGPRPSVAEMEDLVERYTANLMRAALSMSFPVAEAEELVQATFCAYLDGGARYQKRSQLLTYLFGILYNKSREARRQQRRHESIDAQIDPTFDDHFDNAEHWNKRCEEQMNEVEKQAQTSEIGQLLKECLENLGESMRMAFTLKEVEGATSDEICLSLGLTPTNLGVVLFRARNKLRECLTEKGAVIA